MNRRDMRIHKEHGGILMEYMLLVVSVAVLCILGAKALGGLNSEPLNNASKGLNGEAVPAPGAGDPAAGDPPPVGNGGANNYVPTSTE